MKSEIYTVLCLNQRSKNSPGYRVNDVTEVYKFKTCNINITYYFCFFSARNTLLSFKFRNKTSLSYSTAAVQYSLNEIIDTFYFIAA